MVKLLRAGFFRLKKELMFWTFIFATVIVAVIRMLSSAHDIPLDKVLYDYIMYIGFFIAMFVSIFVGKEHSEGIIRNKIIVGYSRRLIYLSKLIISIIVSILCEFIYILFMFCIGSQIYEKLQMSISQLLMIILNVILVIIVYCSIFNFISIMCSEITISLIICVVLFIVMFILEIVTENIVVIPKYITRYADDENGYVKVVSQELNPNYPGDKIVQVAKKMLLLLPQGQARILVDPAFTEFVEVRDRTYTKEELEEKNRNLYQMPIYSFIVICIINVGGLLLFSKKELK